MSLKRNPKILIGLHEVAGYNGNLKKGFDELEIRSIFMELSDHPFKYGGSETNNVLIKLIRYFANKMSTQKEKALNKFFWLYCQQAAKFFLFLCVLFKYDVFIFGYKTSFLHFYDLPILKFIKKMQLKGHSIELIEIIRKTNAEVLDELSRCDFIIDELYSDAAMAGFATEAAFFGKPAIV